MMSEKKKDDNKENGITFIIDPWGRKHQLPKGGIREYYPSSLLDGLTPEQYQDFLDGKWPPKSKKSKK